MLRRQALAAAVAMLLPSPAAFSAEDSAPPNVVLIVTDDQGYGDVGAHGNTMIRTPHLDRLWSESVRLTDYHVDPTCSPTRAALLTGRYSTRTGVWHTIMGRSLMNPDELTLAEVFAANGYRTGMSGKWHLGDNWPLRAEDQGFEEVVRHGGGGVGQGPDWWGNDYFDDTYWRNGQPEPFRGYCTDVWFDEAIAFVERNRARPFFLYVATNAPHAPYNVSEEYSRPYAERGVPSPMDAFYGMITNIDENVGRLRERLRELDLERNTIFIFTTDNGTAAGVARGRNRAGEGEWPGFNAGMRGAKGSEYDGGHRVPFFVYWPDGNLTGGRDVDLLCAHIDVLPTLVDLCGLNKPAGPPLDGVSLKSSLAAAGGPPAAQREGEAARMTDFQSVRETAGPSSTQPQAGRPRLRTLFVHSQRIQHPEKWRQSAVMTKRWRLVNGRELYDIQADPGQSRDVAGGHPVIVEELRAAYDEWWDGLRPAFDDYVRIGLGGDEDPTRLMSHDWHTADIRECVWNQTQVEQGLAGNGPWAVHVARAGRYKVTFYRWPAHLERSMGCTSARLKIGPVDESRELDPQATSASFDVTLPAGPAMLQTWLTRQDGTTHGAYFAEVRRAD
ncbi:MAG TPA: arylsulfatase [Planctomycetaceae bacterium]|nr:arylsulfatase [Planctomycetaceae bacterium]